MRRLRCVMLIACGALLLACGRGPESSLSPAPATVGGPSGELSTVVLISIDTLRADRLPAWGYSAIETPHLDALRREAILYRNAWSHVPLTLPSHATVMTGRLPSELGVRDNVGYRLPSDTPTLASLLRRAGWATGGAVSAAPLHRRTGIDAGFEVWEDRLEGELGSGLGEVQRPASATLDAIRPWLRGVQETDDVFLFFHLFEPHTPYEPPAEIAARWGSGYDGEVVAADAALGALRAELESLGRWRQALVVLFSDHGEGLGDHGEDEHGVLLYREALHVPLLIKLPEARLAGETVTENVQLSDLFPTVLALAGVTDPRPDDPTAASRGRPLLDAAGRLTTPVDRTVLAETYYPRIHLGWSELRSAVQATSHYIHGPDPELYDLASDPAERRNLRATERRRAVALRDEVLDHDWAWSAPTAISDEERAHLASLGYLGATVPDARATRHDPKSQLPVLAALKAGAAAYRQRDYATAVARLDPILAEHPQMADGWTVLGHSLYNLGRHEDALRAYLRVIEQVGASPGVAAPAATLLAEDGQVSAAVRLLRSQLEVAPSATRLRRLEVRLLIGAEAFDAALQRLDAWLVVEPEAAEAWYQRGIARMLTGRSTEAETDLRRCLKLAPDFAPALHDLGVVLSRRGRVDEARDLVRRALEVDPDHPLAAKTLERLRVQP